MDIDFNNLTEEIIKFFAPFILTIVSLFIVYILGSILNVLCFILFIYKKFQKVEYFSTAFFDILNFGYALDLISLISLALMFTKNDILYGINNGISAYALFILGPWNTVIAMNRFTAVCFWKQHEFWWKGKCLAFIFCVLFVCPFIIVVYFLFDGGYCIINPFENNCIGTDFHVQFVATISNGINVIITAVLGVSTSIAARFKLVSLTPETKRFANFLLFQSLISLLLFGGCLYNFLRISLRTSLEDITMTEICLWTLSEFYFVYFRVSSTILLLLLSSFIKNFQKFWSRHENAPESYEKFKSYKKASSHHLTEVTGYLHAKFQIFLRPLFQNAIEKTFGQNFMNYLVFVIGIVYILGSILNVLCFILFIYKKFQKVEYFSKAFFDILNFGYALDLISLISLATVFTRDIPLFGICRIISTYGVFILGPWNTVIAMNRFTAVCFWKKHKFLWKGKCLAFIFALLLIYPFTVGGQFLNNIYCIINPLKEQCFQINSSIQFVATISNGINVIITAILGVSTSIAARFKLVSLTPETKRFANFLLFQSLISLLLFGGCLYNYLRFSLRTSLEDITMTEICLFTLSEFYFVYFRISSTILILILSKVVRKSFIEFYFCKCLCFKKKSSKRVIPTGVFLTERTNLNAAIKIF